MNAIANIKDIDPITQEFDSYLITLPESALSEGYAGLMSVEIDLLTRHIMDSLERTANEATAERDALAIELTVAKSRVATLVTKSLTHEAELSAKQRLIEQLAARTAAAGEVEELQAAAAILSEQLIEQRAIVEEQAAKLEKLMGVNERATDASSQVADLTARLNHATSKQKQLENDLSAARLAAAHEQSRVNQLAEELLDTAKRLKQAESSLAVADKAKQNALAAQKTQLEDQFRGSTRIESDELKELRQKAAELVAVRADLDNARDALAQAHQKAEHHGEQLAEKNRVIDELTELNHELDFTCSQTKSVMDEQHLLLQDRKRRLDFAELTVQYLNQQAIYKNDHGRLSIMSLNPDHIKSTDHHEIHPNKPICWWGNNNGLACVVMVSAEPDETGDHYLIFPSLFVEFNGEEKNMMNIVMPPKETWDEITSVMMQLDSAEMLDVMARGEAAANIYAATRNPDAEAAMQRAICLKNKREALANRHHQQKAAKLAVRKAKQKKPVKPKRATV